MADPLTAGLAAASFLGGIFGISARKKAAKEAAKRTRDQARLDRAIAEARLHNLGAFQTILQRFFLEQDEIFDAQLDEAKRRFGVREGILEGERDVRVARSSLEYDRLGEQQQRIQGQLQSIQTRRRFGVAETIQQLEGERTRLGLRVETAEQQAVLAGEQRFWEASDSFGRLLLSQGSSGASLSSESYERQRERLRRRSELVDAVASFSERAAITDLKTQSRTMEGLAALQIARINEIAALEVGQQESALRESELQRMLLQRIIDPTQARQASQAGFNARMRSLGVKDFGPGYTALFDIINNKNVGVDWAFVSGTEANQSALNAAMLSFDQQMLSLEEQVARNKFSYEDTKLGLEHQIDTADLSYKYGKAAGSAAGLQGLSDYLGAAAGLIGFLHDEGII